MEKLSPTAILWCEKHLVAVRCEWAWTLNIRSNGTEDWPKEPWPLWCVCVRGFNTQALNSFPYQDQHHIHFDLPAFFYQHWESYIALGWFIEGTEATSVYITKIMHGAEKYMCFEWENVFLWHFAFETLTRFSNFRYFVVVIHVWSLMPLQRLMI